MSHTDISGLVRDLVAWVAKEPRPYVEAIEAWRTSCPRLPVWEEAMERGLIACVRRGGGALRVEVTAAGRALLNGG
ncbi:MAG: hypothetical protein K2X11_22535 [Acetobacteraceae bacterium]|nr:hypothetical protein [Acetobacteraceae bacterium]